MKEVPITGGALSANRLNDVSAALSYVLKLVGGQLHQYDHLNLFTTFPVLDMNKISQGTAWNNHFIDLFLWIDDLDLETARMTVVRWIRQFIEDDEESIISNSARSAIHVLNCEYSELKSPITRI